MVIAKNHVALLQSKLLQGVCHGFTQKPHSFGGLACDKTLVAQSKEQLQKELTERHPQFSGQLFIPSQCHCNTVKLAPCSDLSDCDALVTVDNNVVIGVLTADCVPVLLFDPVNKVAAVAHAGWKGTQQQIAKVTVQKMKQWGNSNPSDIIAVIGPAISLQSFEVSAEVVEALKPTVSDNYLSQLFVPDIDTNEPDKWLVDLKAINQHQLIDAGLNANSIDVLPDCTVVDNHLYHSHRKGDVGRQLAFIMGLD